MALIHGGQLNSVAAQFNIPVQHWLNLSTGIAPQSYPIVHVPMQFWQELPQQNNELLNAAKQYYQAENLLITNGSQSIIKVLPQLWLAQNPTSRDVFIPQQGYKEHASAWQKTPLVQHEYKEQLPSIQTLTPYCVLVIINPNNPSGCVFLKDELLQYQQAISKLNGLLIIDEAFADVIQPSVSLANNVSLGNTVVLKSFGKFFGLAGIRIGFVISNPYWLNILNEVLGPWQVNGPAQYIAQIALQDNLWQKQQQSLLAQQCDLLQQVLTEHIPRSWRTKIAGTHLFQTVYFQESIDVEKIYQELCQQAIYVRLTDDHCALRFGLITTKNAKRLANALARIMKNNLNK